MEEKNRKTVKLHEILACENDIKNKAKSIVDETVNTFTSKDSHFNGLTKNYLANEVSDKDEITDQIPPETKEVVTTVPEKMKHTIKALIEAIDVTLSKEETNASGKAHAELIVGDTSFGILSATTLLSLEGTLTKLRSDLYKTIPTLDPTMSWSKDTDSERPGVFKTEPSTKFRTVTRRKPLVAYPATEQHPAQVTMETFEQQVGRYLTVNYSGKISPKAKSDIIERLDKLIFSVKQARAKANNVDIISVKLAENLFNYVHGTDLV